MQRGALRGLLWMFLSTFGFSISHLIVRYVSPEIHSSQSVFFRGFFGLLVVLPWILRSGVSILKTNRLGLHVLRALFSVASLTCFYYALTVIPLAKATAIGFIAPILVSVLAVLLLKESSRPAHWLALGLGLLGMLLVLRPGRIPLDFGTVMMIGSTLLFSVNLLFIKILSREDSSIVITGYLTLLLVPLSLPMAVSVWVWPDTTQFLLLAVMGVVNVSSLLLFTQAMREAAILVIMPLDYLRLIWMALLGYLFFFEEPDPVVWIGGAIIFSGVLLVAISERSRLPALDS